MDALMTASGAASAIVPQIWSAKFTENLRNALPWIDTVARDYEGEIKQLGDRVFIPTLPDTSDGGVLVEGAKADADATTASTTSLIINKRVFKDFIITDQAQLQSIAFMDQLREIAINAIMQKMQTLIITEIAPSVSAPAHNISYNSGTTLAAVDILAAKRLLDKQNVPEEGRSMISGTSQANDLLNIINLVNSQYNPAVNGAAPSVTGKVANDVYGFSPKKTNANGTVSYFFHRTFLQMAVQKALTLKIFDLGVAGERSYRLNVDLLFGVKQNFSTRIVKVS